MAYSQKYVFLQALILTIIVFNVGIFFGYQLESSRVDRINDWYLQSDIELLDQKIQRDALNFLDFDCGLLVQENIDFADRIYEEAQKIGDFEKANRINKEIISQHKRYDLLRTLFWINSIEIKKKCESDYHNVVYFYDYNEPSINQKSEQEFFSNLLFELKQEKGSGLMLIPIAGDNDLPSVNLLMKEYGIVELPSILIDEEIVLTNVESRGDIEEYLK